MCQKVTCNSCNKLTWKGCGLHIQTALHGIELNDRCPNWKKGSSHPCSSSSGNNNNLPSNFNDDDNNNSSSSQEVRSAWAGN